MTVRKHLYLITEHENSDRVGQVAFYDRRFSHPTKNEEAPVTIRDEDTKGFRDVGKKVGLGYHDFSDQDAVEDRAEVVIIEKLTEVDREWVEKAGLADSDWYQEATA